jgi:hypothetical protein
VIRALTASLGFAYAAHSPTLTSLIIPAAAAFAAATTAYTVHALRRTRRTA